MLLLRAVRLQGVTKVMHRSSLPLIKVRLLHGQRHRPITYGTALEARYTTKMRQ
jgi:hypothetical protein